MFLDPRPLHGAAVFDRHQAIVEESRARLDQLLCGRPWAGNCCQVRNLLDSAAQTPLHWLHVLLQTSIPFPAVATATTTSTRLSLPLCCAWPHAGVF